MIVRVVKRDGKLYILQNPNAEVPDSAVMLAYSAVMIVDMERGVCLKNKWGMTS